MTSPPELKLDGDFYQHFQTLLEDQVPGCSPAEVHGILTGLTCSGESQTSFDSWQNLLIDSKTQSSHGDRVGDALNALITLIDRALQSQDFAFRLLLPPDSDSATNRTQALAHWCHGFTLGLRWNGAIEPNTLEPDAAEAIIDIADIARADTTSVVPDDETAIAEIEEYLRVAAQLIFEATRSLPAAAQPKD